MRWENRTRRLLHNFKSPWMLRWSLENVTESALAHARSASKALSRYWRLWSECVESSDANFLVIQVLLSSQRISREKRKKKKHFGCNFVAEVVYTVVAFILRARETRWVRRFKGIYVERLVPWRDTNNALTRHFESGRWTAMRFRKGRSFGSDLRELTMTNRAEWRWLLIGSIIASKVLNRAVNCAIYRPIVFRCSVEGS